MGRQATLSYIVACRLLIYTSPAAYIASTTKGNYHSIPAPHFAVIPVICRAAQWWNPSRTLRIYPITTQILLPYRRTKYAIDLYIAHRACNVAPVLYSTLSSIPHRLRYFSRFW